MQPGRRRFLGWSEARQRDERGATFILTAICMVLLLWAGAFGVDLGFTVDGNRQAQAMADTAALDVTRYIGIADQEPSLSAVTTYLNGKLANVATDNGTNTTFSFLGGVWSGTTFTPATGGCWYFYPQYDNPCNAVKVTATQTVPQIFGGGNATVSRSAIAEQAPEGGFSVGSYLANISTSQSQAYGVLSDVLGTLAPSISVSAVGFQGLANTDVSLSQLIGVSGTALTASDVLTTPLPASEWPTLLNDAITNQVAPLNCAATPTPSPCVASQDFSNGGLGVSSSTPISLCQLVSISWNTPSSGDYSSCSNGVVPPAALAANLNVLQILTTEAEVANGTNEIAITNALGITGLTTAYLSLSVGQPPQVAFGPVGTEASTAQVQATMTLNIPAVGQVTIGPFSAASATSTLAAMSCTNNAFSAGKTSSTTQTSSATVAVPGYSGISVSISGVTSSSQTFNSSNVPPSASTYAPASGPPSNPKQIGSTTPTPSFSGLGSTNPAYTVLTTLAPVLWPILQAAGVSVGNASVAFLSANCGSVSLVQ